jgi:hypothetical protein
VLQTFGKQKQAVAANDSIGLSDTEFLGPSDSHRKTGEQALLLSDEVLEAYWADTVRTRSLLVCNCIAQWFTIA